MVEHALQRIRNIGVMAHIDAGKTTVTERILYYTGKTSYPGEVEHGTTVMDWMPQEQARGITITAAATTCEWKQHQLNIIDTPGHVDFSVEVERSLRVLDGVISVICALKGVQSQTETVWKQADKYKIPRLVFVNKMDRTGADFFRAIKQLNSKLSAHAIPIQFPIFLNGIFEGNIDLIHLLEIRYDRQTLGAKTKISPLSELYREQAINAREELIEILAHFDSNIEEAFLEDRHIPTNLIKKVIRDACCSGELVPVICGTAFNNKGIQSLLDAIVLYLPSPLETEYIRGYREEAILDQKQTGRILTEDDKETRTPDSNGPLVAYAFKLMHIGNLELVFLRIYAGKISKNDHLLNATKAIPEKLSAITRLHANHFDEISSAGPGEIIAVIGLKYTTTGDTLTALSSPIVLEQLAFPAPVISQAIELFSEKDTKHLEQALMQISKEDPTLQFNIDPHSGQKIISGLGELHLEIVVERLLREHKINLLVGKPTVALRETVTSSEEAISSYTHKNSKNSAKVRIRVQQGLIGTGVVILSKLQTEAFSHEVLLAAESGIREATEKGVLSVAPMHDIIVTFLEATIVKNDDSTCAVIANAARQATAIALKKANPKIMEPIFTVEVEVPEDYTGAIIGDLRRRRGNITNFSAHIGSAVITALVPLTELLGYASSIRSMSRGHATFSMEFVRFELVL